MYIFLFKENRVHVDINFCNVFKEYFQFNRVFSRSKFFISKCRYKRMGIIGAVMVVKSIAYNQYVDLK